MGKRLFRACRDMRYKKGTVPPGTLVWLDKPEETIAKLLGLQVIAPVRCPPLEALPGWEERGPRIEKAGVEGVEDFLGREPVDLAELLGVSVDEVKSWQRQLAGWLSGSPAAG